MQYIDSSVFVATFLPTDPNHKVCRGVMDTMIHDRLPTAISVFGLAEIGGFFTRNTNEKMGLKYVRTLQRMENLQIHYADDFETFMDSVLAVRHPQVCRQQMLFILCRQFHCLKWLRF